MSFHKMVFYLKEAHVLMRCDHAPLQNSYTQPLKMIKNWSPKIHAITFHMDFKHIMGKENVLAESLSRLRHLGIYEDNDHEKSGNKYGKSILTIIKIHYIVLAVIKI